MGEVVRVKITLVAPNDLHFLVLEDPLPAGTEAIDLSLRTTSVVNEPPEIEYEGTTGIVDPDSDGEFPEAEWCEEC